MLTDENIMPWNPYRGKPMREVPESYWIWCLKQPWFEEYEDLYEYAKLAVRRPESFEEAVRMLYDEPRRPKHEFKTRKEMKEG